MLPMPLKTPAGADRDDLAAALHGALLSNAKTSTPQTASQRDAAAARRADAFVERRSRAVAAASGDAPAAALPAVWAYHSHVASLEVALDGAAAGAVSWAWTDAFQPARTCTLAAVTYERASILFLCGALESRAAAALDRSAPAALAEAQRRFESAAACFGACAAAAAGSPACHGASVDLADDALSMGRHLMLAQAQACCYEAAIHTGGASEPADVASLAAATADHYAHAAQHAATASVDPSWGRHATFQRHCFAAVAQLWRSKVEAAAGDRPAYVGRLGLSVAACDAALGGTGTDAGPALDPSLTATAHSLKTMLTNELAAAAGVEPATDLPPIPPVSRVDATRRAVPADAPGPDLALFAPPLVPDHAAAACGPGRAAALEAEAAAEDGAWRQALAALSLPAALDAYASKASGLSDATWASLQKLRADTGGAGAVAEAVATVALRAEATEAALAAHEESLKAHADASAAFEDRCSRVGFVSGLPAGPGSGHADATRKVTHFGKLKETAAAADAAMRAKAGAACYSGALAALDQTREALDAGLRGTAAGNSDLLLDMGGAAAAAYDTAALSAAVDRLGRNSEARAAAVAAAHAAAPTPETLLASRAAALLGRAETTQPEGAAALAAAQAALEAAAATQASALSDVARENALFAAAVSAEADSDPARTALGAAVTEGVETCRAVVAQASKGVEFYDGLLGMIEKVKTEFDDSCCGFNLVREEEELELSQRERAQGLSVGGGGGGGGGGNGGNGGNGGMSDIEAALRSENNALRQQVAQLQDTIRQLTGGGGMPRSMPAPPPPGQHLQVTVAAGAKPGDVLHAQAPDGRTLAITVPPGTRPGNILTVALPPMPGSLPGGGPVRSPQQDLTNLPRAPAAPAWAPPPPPYNNPGSGGAPPPPYTEPPPMPPSMPPSMQAAPAPALAPRGLSAPLIEPPATQETSMRGRFDAGLGKLRAAIGMGSKESGQGGAYEYAQMGDEESPPATALPPSTAQAQAQAPAPAPLPPPPPASPRPRPEDVAALVSMGFEEDAAVAALVAQGGDVGAAVAALCT